eukprot:TRINITY_DN1866_c0_g1_i1.p1 TRINITY_DN1866_c0_g1~~TRINITY_DN1866_c0_g1_i1.p1  ORF type:complete len:538 (+),score=103.56 TRINITY_DN1866_c0_g1_i1:122-1735(+)
MVTALEIVLLVVFAMVVIAVLAQPRIPLFRCARAQSISCCKTGYPFGMSGITLDLGLAPPIGVLLLLICTAVTGEDIRYGIMGDDQIQPYTIVILFMSLAYVCISLDVTGLLTYIAYRATLAAGNSGRKLFLYIFMLSSIFTIATSNDIVILTITPMICHFSKSLRIDPVPFLMAQFFAANIWSALLFIGNPTNIIVALAFDISFLEFSRWMSAPAIASGLTALLLLFLALRSRIPISLGSQQQLQGLDASSSLKDKTGAIIGSIVLVGCLLMIATSFWTKIPLWAVTSGSAGVLLIRDLFHDWQLWRTHGNTHLSLSKEHEQPAEHGEFVGVRMQQLKDDEEAEDMSSSLPVNIVEESDHNDEETWFSAHLPTVSLVMSRMPWKVVPFVVSMFIMTNALYHASWFAAVAYGIGVAVSGNVWASVFLFGFGGSFLGNVLNNQPMTILMTRLLSHPAFVTSPCVAKAAQFALIAGSNFGANFTFLGALAGIMWSKMLRDKGISSITFFTFMRYGIIIMPVVVAVGCLVLAAEIQFMCV